MQIVKSTTDKIIVSIESTHIPLIRSIQFEYTLFERVAEHLAC